MLYYFNTIMYYVFSAYEKKGLEEDLQLTETKMRDIDLQSKVEELT